MGITINHEQAAQGKYLVPEGTYEALISEAKFDTTGSGTEFIRLRLQIREDIPQSEGGQSFDWPIWKLKAPASTDPGGYSNARLQNISRCAGLANGTELEGMDDLLQAWTGKAIKVEIKHNERNGYTNADVGYIYPSEHPDIRQGFIAVEDGDLPF